MSPLRVERWGRLPYPEAHARMKALLDARVGGRAPDTLVLCEHEPVFTLGRARGAAAHVHDPGGAPVIPVERGGDVTFHGPGQLVAYPVVGLPPHRRDLHAWLAGLETVAMRVLARWGVAGGRDARNTGVWVEGRKIAAIGIAVRRWVSWHGLSLNVDVDLAWFHRIEPCGMAPELVTRLADHVRPSPALDEVSAAFEADFRAWWAAWAAAPDAGLATPAPTE